MALVRISASDGAQKRLAMTGEADLGTQFAFATSLHGGNRVQVSGDLGYGATGGLSASVVPHHLQPRFHGDVTGSFDNDEAVVCSLPPNGIDNTDRSAPA